MSFSWTFWLLQSFNMDSSVQTRYVFIFYILLLDHIEDMFAYFGCNLF